MHTLLPVLPSPYFDMTDNPRARQCVCVCVCVCGGQTAVLVTSKRGGKLLSLCFDAFRVLGTIVPIITPSPIAITISMPMHVPVNPIRPLICRIRIIGIIEKLLDSQQNLLETDARFPRLALVNNAQTDRA